MLKFLINNTARSRKPKYMWYGLHVFHSKWLTTKEIVLSKDIPIHIYVHLLINYNSQLHTTHKRIYIIQDHVCSNIRKVNPIQKLNSLCRFVQVGSECGVVGRDLQCLSITLAASISYFRVYSPCSFPQVDSPFV